MNHVSRRNFLKLSGAAGLATFAAPFGAFAAPTSPGPFNRAGRPRLLLSLAAYSFRESFSGMRGKPNPKAASGKAMDMFQFIDFCATHGCDGAELTSYFFTDDSEDYMIKLRRHAYLRGVAVSGTAIGNNFSLPKGPALDQQIADTKKWIDRALLLGAQHIRVFAGNVPKDAPKGFTREKADQIAIGALKECCEYAGKKGIFLGLENHDSIGSSATLISMVKAVNSPWIGINLDSGNFRTADPYKDFAECVPYTLNVQYKSELRDMAGKVNRPADFKRFTKILRDGGYQGWVALEYEAKEDPMIAVPRILKQMRELFAG